VKIGFSLSTCLADVLDGAVNVDDVLVIVSGTKFDPNNDEQWRSLFFQYSMWGGPWEPFADREDEIRELVITLEKTGRLHQPRKFGASAGRPNMIWADVVPELVTLESSPAIQQAWARFNLIAGLAGDSQ